ncbi:unnamed protein product [Larinioides sclopetarius]
MSIVKMVNSTAVNFKKSLNDTIDSCPLYNMVMEEIFLESDAEGEYNWSPEIQGYVLSAGFLGYVISQLPGGLAAETYGAKRVYLSGVLLASLAHLLSPLAAWHSCYTLIVIQLLRGLGQGFQSPANSVVTANWFPKHERGFLNSLIFLGSGVGSFITYTTSGAMCSSSTLLGGWPSVYFIYGGLGLVLSLCIHLFLYDSPKEHPNIGRVELLYILENQENDLFQKKPPTPWNKILTSIPVYVMTFSVFSHFWAFTHQISEHPIFLANILHFPIETNGILNAIPFVFQTLMIFLGGWVSKWLNTHGYAGVDKVRKGCTMLYSLGYSAGLLGMYIAGCDRIWSNAFSFIAFSFVGLSYAGCLSVPSDMSPTYAGSLFAFSNTIASTAAFIFPLIIGMMIYVEESLEQWNKIFILCITVVMSSGILFCLFGSADVVPWNFPSIEVWDRNRPKDEALKSGSKECTLSKGASIHI